MPWSSKMKRWLVVEMCIRHLPLIHATESMVFSKQKELICYNKTMMWCFSVSEKQRMRGKYCFQEEESERLPSSWSRIANMGDKYFIFLITFLNHYGNIRLWIKSSVAEKKWLKMQSVLLKAQLNCVHVLFLKLFSLLLKFILEVPDLLQLLEEMNVVVCTGCL